MKYGIDVNNELISKRVLETIKVSGNVVVDLSIEKWSNRGQEVFKRVLLGNITSIDFYLGIELSLNESECKLFYSNNEYAKKQGFKIVESLSSDFKYITCEEGDYLYLIRNMDCPGIYIKMNLSEKVEENIKLIDKILEDLIDSK